MLVEIAVMRGPRAGMDHPDGSSADSALDDGRALRNESEMVGVHSRGESRSFARSTEETHLVIAQNIGEAATPDHPDHLVRESVLIDRVAGNEDFLDTTRKAP